MCMISYYYSITIESKPQKKANIFIPSEKKL